MALNVGLLLCLGGPFVCSHVPHSRAEGSSLLIATSIPILQPLLLIIIRSTDRLPTVVGIREHLGLSSPNRHLPPERLGLPRLPEIEMEVHSVYNVDVGRVTLDVMSCSTLDARAHPSVQPVHATERLRQSKS
jgi:hypothetical protein